MEFLVLQGIEDVTAKVNGAVQPNMSTADAGKAQRETMAALEKECSSGDIRCDVVTLYSGAMYNLYKYKKYDDIRLVFAPEFSIAFFGGDPDNFEYPRYDLDISFFRAYENGEAGEYAELPEVAAERRDNGELTFVSGHPGRTGRLLTMDQMGFLRDYQFPLQLESYKRRIDVLQKFGAQSAENEREAQSDMFGLQNAQKAVTGYLGGLKDKELMAGKSADEKSLQQFVSSDPTRKQEFGDPWAADFQGRRRPEADLQATAFPGRMGGFRGDLARYARYIVRAAGAETEAEQRALPAVHGLATADAGDAAVLHRSYLQEPGAGVAGREPGRDARRAGRRQSRRAEGAGGQDPEERAKEIIEGTKLDDVAVRKQLYEGGEAAVNASTDPMIVMMRAIEPDAAAIHERDEDQVQAVLRQSGGQIGKALFAQKGLSVPPDATFTLRLSYGPVEGYKLDGKNVSWFTTMGGAYEHAAKHGSKPPYQLPDSWIKAKSAVAPKTPFDTVSTSDIIGGNSGSPVINKAGEVVGIVFDGNIESLAWNFAYTDKVARAVEVDTRGITESLKKIYHADGLLNGVDGTGCHGSAS